MQGMNAKPVFGFKRARLRLTETPLRRPLAPAGPRSLIARSSPSTTVSAGRHPSSGSRGTDQRNVSEAAER